MVEARHILPGRQRLKAVVLSGFLLFGGAALPAHAAQTVEQANVAVTLTIDTLDPTLSTLPLPIFKSIFDQLTELKPDGTLAPRLATAWSANADATVWTFDLRSDARFSDGKPVTADDVVFSVQAILDNPKSLVRGFAAAIASVSKVGEAQVRFQMKGPFAYWPQQASFFSIVSKSAYEAGPESFAAKPVGSGPYKVDSWDRSGSLELSRNEGYWGRKPAIARMTVRTVADETARLNALSSGSVDVAQIGPAQVPVVRRIDKLAVASSVANKTIYLGFNTTVPGLDSEKLRLGINRALDREAISRSLMQGLAQPTAQIISPPVLGYDPGLVPVPRSIDEAKQLIAQSGYDGREIVFQFPTAGIVPLSTQLAQAVGESLRQAGVNVKLQSTDQPTFIQLWIGKQMKGIYLFAYQVSSLDGGQLATQLYGANGNKYFTDPEMDALVASQQGEVDGPKRLGLLAQIGKRSADKGYYAPLFIDSWSYAWNKGKLKVSPRADGFIVPHELDAAD